MATVKVYSCLVCDDLRPEINNKATLLGFYGVMPHVEMYIHQPEAPARLLFLAMFAPVTGTHEITANLLNPDGSPIVDDFTVPLQGEPNAVSNAVGFSFMSIFLGQKGSHTFLLKEGKREIYRSTFRVHHGVRVSA